MQNIMTVRSFRQDLVSLWADTLFRPLTIQEFLFPQCRKVTVLIVLIQKPRSCSKDKFFLRCHSEEMEAGTSLAWLVGRGGSRGWPQKWQQPCTQKFGSVLGGGVVGRHHWGGWSWGLIDGMDLHSFSFSEYVCVVVRQLRCWCWHC